MIVPTFERASLLDGCLRALLAQRAELDYEIIVVDDASGDDTASVLAAWQSVTQRLRVLRQPENRGPAAARNAGVLAATGDVLAFTDDDCEPDPTWLTHLVRALIASPPDVVGVGGRVLAARPGIIGEYMTRHRILEPPASLSYLVTANCAYWRQPVLDVGGFDEAIRYPGGEDPGLSLALRARGHRFAFSEHAVVCHHYRESLADFARTFYRYGRGCRHVLDG